jgi:taurine--2-oxoglutarate transaminase
MGVFWALELVSDRETRAPLPAYNASGPADAPMNELAAACKSRGMVPFINGNRLHVVPPCTISGTEAKEGVAILDEALSVADASAH